MASDLRELQEGVGEDVAPISGDLGEVVYSPASSIKKGRFYVLGLNPGGDGQLNRDTGEAHTVGSHLDRMLDRADHSVWDEDWINGMEPEEARRGVHRYQRALAEILGHLGVEDASKRDVFTTNLIFTTTPTAAHLHDFDALADVCWRAHERFIDVVQPEVIVCVGNGGRQSAYGWVYSKLQREVEEERFRVRGKLGSTYLATGNLRGRETRVLGVPHLSRFSMSPRALKWASGQLTRD